MQYGTCECSFRRFKSFIGYISNNFMSKNDSWGMKLQQSSNNEHQYCIKRLAAATAYIVCVSSDIVYFYRMGQLWIWQLENVLLIQSRGQTKKSIRALRQQLHALLTDGYMRFANRFSQETQPSRENSLLASKAADVSRKWRKIDSSNKQTRNMRRVTRQISPFFFSTSHKMGEDHFAMKQSRETVFMKTFPRIVCSRGVIGNELNREWICLVNPW